MQDQLDTTNNYLLVISYSSTCFRRFYAHHQESRLRVTASGFGLRVKYQLFLSDLMRFEFFQRFFLKSSNFMKIRPMGVELFHEDRQMEVSTDGRMDRQTDRVVDRLDEANSRFSKFCKRAKQFVLCKFYIKFATHLYIRF